MSKRELRQEALRSRRSLSPETIAVLSKEVQTRLLRLPEFLRATVVASYVAKSDEVQTEGIISAALSSGKRVIVPRADPASLRLRFSEILSLSELSTGHFGILEPAPGKKAVPLSECQVALVPVVAWERRGRRLGYGKGYFDRELESRGQCLAVGLAFESQRAESLPNAPTDVPMDIIVTENRTLRLRRNPVV